MRPLTHAIETYRSLSVFRNTFIMAPLDPDGRMRCSINVAGTETYRFSTSKNAWGRGTNLQNIPRNRDRWGEDHTEAWRRPVKFPNVRELFLADQGMVIGDIDLDRADAQVVAMESGDEELKQMLREGVDIHTENAKVLGVTRDQAKQGVHAVNYVVTARTLAATIGITVHEADLFIHRWFAAHPDRDWETSA